MILLSSMDTLVSKALMIRLSLHRSPASETSAAQTPRFSVQFFKRQLPVTTDLSITSATVDSRCSGGVSGH